MASLLLRGTARTKVLRVGLTPRTYAGQAIGVKRLPTDAIGNCVLTLTSLVVGSVVQIEVASTGAVVVNTSAIATTLVLSLPVYQAGSASNNLRIKVRKGSASPYYQPFETLETVFVGADSIYISQTPDE